MLLPVTENGVFIRKGKKEVMLERQPAVSATPQEPSRVCLCVCTTVLTGSVPRVGMFNLQSVYIINKNDRSYQGLTWLCHSGNNRVAVVRMRIGDLFLIQVIFSEITYFRFLSIYWNKLVGISSPL